MAGGLDPWEPLWLPRLTLDGSWLALLCATGDKTCAENGRLIVPLPRKENIKPLGESRAQAVRGFLSLERNLHARNQFEEFGAVMEEYFKLGHAEAVPRKDFEKPPCQVFYLPMHAVRKDSSTTTMICAVFDASKDLNRCFCQ